MHAILQDIIVKSHIKNPYFLSWKKTLSAPMCFKKQHNFQQAVRFSTLEKF